ncbi:retrotransposon protein, putative, ty1-copia subclass [Tanacetum coccineum]
MMILTTLPKSFWGYALESTASILKMVPTKKVDRTSYKIWQGKAPKLSNLRVWGCEAHVKRDTPDKLDSRSIKCIFIGYPKEAMGYYFYKPLENKIFVARNAEFFENSLTLQEAKDDTKPSENTSKRHDEIEPDEIEPNEVKSQSGEVPICRSRRISQAPDRYSFYVDAEEHELGDLNEPLIIRVDYGETFSHVADNRAIKILLAIAVFYDYEIWQMDVKTAFLNGHQSDNLYMVQPVIPRQGGNARRNKIGIVITH